MSVTLQPTPDLWKCGEVCITYRNGVTIPCSGHKVTPLIRQQAETAAWMDGHEWIHTDQHTRQGYLNNAGRFVTGRTGK